MQVHRLEDYRIQSTDKVGQDGTGGYYVNRMGHKKETMVYCGCIMRPHAGEFSAGADGLKS